MTGGGSAEERLRRMIAGAAGMVALHRDALDAINVFPVPDGDTGANLSRTLAGASSAAEDAPLGRAAAEMAEGGLRAARGSSGVIGSQWLRGFAAELDGNELGPEPISAALRAGAEAARAAVAEPREGSMISVARDAAQASGGDAESILESAIAAAEESVERTPMLNPVLADAGVVDAGGRGLELILRGMLAGLRGEEPPPAAADFGRIDPSWLAGRLDEAAGDGFCTELIVAGAGEAALAGPMRELAAASPETVMIAPDPAGCRVHLHVPEPELAWARAGELGQLRLFHAVDMALQSARAHGGDDDPAVLAVVQGAGFAQIFRELGAAALIGGGPGDNASVELIRSAADSIGRAEVIVLPNHPDVAAAARSAADASDDPKIHVVETATQAAGVAAIAAFVGGIPGGDAAAEMEIGRDSVLVGSLTIAARDAGGDVPVRAGRPLAMLDGRVAAAAPTFEQAADELIAEMRAESPHGSLLTLFQGAPVSDDEADALMDAVCAATDLEVELVDGGQPLYHWLIALE